MTGETQARAATIEAFLAHAGLADAGREPLAGDASTRRYVRLRRAGRPSLILMDAPPLAESAPASADADAQARRASGYNALARLSACRVDAFAAISGWLRNLGFSAPEVHAFDVAAGLAVLEDLGEDLYARRLEAGEAAGPLYASAIDVLARLHAETPPQVAHLEGTQGWPILPYDALALKTGADLFLEWWPRYAGLPPFGSDAVQAWEGLWAGVQARGEAGASVLAHRDYHVENLLWLPDRQGLARVGLLDFQDAVRAHPAWDLLSLLQDARRDVDPALEAAMLERYFAARPRVEPAGFLSDYAGLAALNNARITGLFARLVVRDGKPRYRVFLPRLWRLLERNLRHRDLDQLKDWFDRNVPAGARA